MNENAPPNNPIDLSPHLSPNAICALPTCTKLISEHRLARFGPRWVAYYGPTDPLPHPHGTVDVAPAPPGPKTRAQLREEGRRLIEAAKATGRAPA